MLAAREYNRVSGPLPPHAGLQSLLFLWSLRKASVTVDAVKQQQMVDLFSRMAATAKGDPTTAEQIRDALAESGLLSVFGVGETLDVVDLLDVGGDEALRTRLRQMTLTELKQIIGVRQYDPEKETARWRSPNKLIDLIVKKASEQLERELAQQSTSGADWML
jgi:hypothetical protein